MSNSPRTGASVIALRDNQVLLIKRGKEPYKGYWSLPGGSQEFGETLEECARREFKEETNLDADVLLFVTARDRIYRGGNGEISFHYVLGTFITEEFKGEAKAMDDAEDIGWFDIKNLAELKIIPDTPDFIIQVLNDLN